MINCKTYEDCVKQRVHCPICSKDYAIYSLTHVCSEILPCAFPKKTDYVERYLDNVSEGDIPDILCEKCHFITNIATQPRKCKCPKCEYEGYYVHDETELCPACKVVIPPKKPKRVVEKVAEVVVESVPEVVKPVRSPITIFVEVKAGDLNYSDVSEGEIIGGDFITLRAMTHENIVSGDWGGQTCIGNVSRQEMMNEFYKYFINVASVFTISWEFNFLGRQWIEGVWNKHRPAGSIDIKFHKHGSYEITADIGCRG